MTLLYSVGIVEKHARSASGLARLAFPFTYSSQGDVPCRKELVHCEIWSGLARLAFSIPIFQSRRRSMSEGIADIADLWYLTKYAVC